jgi:hypothetical protein
MRILRSAHAALNLGGLVIVRGYYADPGRSEARFGALFRLNLLLSDPGRTPPTVRDLVSQLERAGFRQIRSFALTGQSSCVVGTR